MLTVRLLSSVLAALSIAMWSAGASAQIGRSLPRRLAGAAPGAARRAEEIGSAPDVRRAFDLGDRECGRRRPIATDYNDYVRPQVVPDIATMNRAHTTHYSNFPDPNIKHVLKGWSEGSSPVKHDLTFSDVRVRNVVTNIRDWSGGANPDPRIPSSCSRSPACASATSATCTTP